MEVANWESLLYMEWAVMIGWQGVVFQMGGGGGGGEDYSLV
jgi:hypothetical protein